MVAVGVGMRADDCRKIPCAVDADDDETDWLVRVLQVVDDAGGDRCGGDLHVGMEVAPDRSAAPQLLPRRYPVSGGHTPTATIGRARSFASATAAARTSWFSSQSFTSTMIAPSVVGRRGE